MALPAAIRIDHDPFVLPPAEIPGVPIRSVSRLSLFVFLRWTSYACPHCKFAFRRDFWPENIRLGNSERICKECGKPFDDGAREWPELKLSRKLRFLFPPGVQVMTGGFLFCAIFTLVIAPKDVVNPIVIAVVSGVSLLPTLLWCSIRFLSVLRSTDRFETTRKVREG